jgi:hypothetical protein
MALEINAPKIVIGDPPPQIRLESGLIILIIIAFSR